MSPGPPSRLVPAARLRAMLSHAAAALLCAALVACGLNDGLYSVSGNGTTTLLIPICTGLVLGSAAPTLGTTGPWRCSGRIRSCSLQVASWSS